MYSVVDSELFSLTLITWLGKIKLDFKPFSALIALTEVPYCCEILPKVSPDFTVCVAASAVAVTPVVTNCRS